jgi:hypothetical protein
MTAVSVITVQIANAMLLTACVANKIKWNRTCPHSRMAWSGGLAAIASVFIGAKQEVKTGSVLKMCCDLLIQLN